MKHFGGTKTLAKTSYFWGVHEWVHLHLLRNSYLLNQVCFKIIIVVFSGPAPRPFYVVYYIKGHQIRVLMKQAALGEILSFFHDGGETQSQYFLTGTEELGIVFQRRVY